MYIKLSTLLCLMLFSAASSAEPEDKWAALIEFSVGKPIYHLHNQLLHTEYFPSLPKEMLSLGSGAGNEEVELLYRGHSVTAIDVSARSGEVLRERAIGTKGRVRFFQGTFDKAPLEGNYQVAIAYFSLPFGDKSALPTLMSKVSSHMPKGAVISANFFGYQHSMVKEGIAYGMTRDEIKALLEKNGFSIRVLLNRVYDQMDFDGNKTHWDVFDFIAEKQ